MSFSSKAVVYTEMQTPVGPLTIASTNKGVCWVNFGSSEDNIFILERWVKRWIGSDIVKKAEHQLDNIIMQLTEYFEGNRKKFDIEVDLYGTPFQKLVWNTLITIPYGEVRSYKDIAIKINSPKSVRAVGGANHNNPVAIIIPCHRVIGSNGNLVGYGGGLEIKKYLLELEGMYRQVKNVL